jgi:hypothetical protein
MRIATAILLGAGLLAGCGGSNTNTGANSVVNSMNSNAKNMPGTNNNTGYVMNSNQTSPPSMPSNATNVSPPSVSTGGANNSNSHSNANKSNK